MTESLLLPRQATLILLAHIVAEARLLQHLNAGACVRPLLPSLVQLCARVVPAVADDGLSCVAEPAPVGQVGVSEELC